MAWHRKHRPRKISELHLTNIRESLLQMMKQGKFPQVMLFAGPKGTGKTSSARIIGNLLNDEANSDLVDVVYFGKDSKKIKQKSFKEPKTDHKFAEKIYAGTSFVVQEMDAASHRGIDDVRALKERVMLPPQHGKMAVYILDEAHMLTTEAFNALLKLLEEPPQHAVFILATTELHKIPGTITSRSTKLDFRKATEAEVKQALESVLKTEKIKFNDEAISLVAQRADGSFRDAVKSAEMAVLDSELTKESVELALGGSIDDKLSELINAVLAKDEQVVVEIISSIREQNLAEGFFYKTLFSFLHQSLLRGLGVDKVNGEARQGESRSERGWSGPEDGLGHDGEPVVGEKVAKFLLEELLKADLEQYTPIPFLPLELKLLSLIQRSKDKSGVSPAAKKKIQKDRVQKEVVEPIQFEAQSQKIDSVVNVSPVIKEEVVGVVSASKDPIIDVIPDNIKELGKNLLEKWEDFVEAVHIENATLAALLRSGKLLIDDEGVPELGVYYKFHLEQLELLKNIKVIQDCTHDVFGNNIPLRVVLQETPIKAKLVEPDSDEAPKELTKLAEEALM